MKFLILSVLVLCIVFYNVQSYEVLQAPNSKTLKKTPNTPGALSQKSDDSPQVKKLKGKIAVLEKRCGLPIGHNDVFLNIVGGIKMNDPAIDLAILTALISSLNNIHVNKKTCFAAEVGLTGEIRSVNRVEQRIQEADRLGFDAIYVSKHSLKNVKTENLQIEVKAISKVEDLLYEVFG